MKKNISVVLKLYFFLFFILFFLNGSINLLNNSAVFDLDDDYIENITGGQSPEIKIPSNKNDLSLFLNDSGFIFQKVLILLTIFIIMLSIPLFFSKLSLHSKRAPPVI
jgi:hypothetical protein